MSDYIVHASGAGNQVRIFAASTRDLVEKAREIHNTSPVATAALGRLLTAGAMMGSMMKGEKDLLTLQVQGDGPMHGLTVTANANGGVKGYPGVADVILPPNAAGKLNVGGAIGNGVLSVIKDMGLKDPYVGQTELQTGEIAEDLTYYFASSEQIPTSVALGVLMNKENTVRQAGGFMIQMMPFASDEVITALEERLKDFTSVTSHLDRGETPEDMMAELFEGMDMTIEDKIPTEFYCNCSKERVSRAVISVGKKELADMIEEGKPIEVNCHFCNSHYNFSVEELEEMLKAAR